MGAPFSDFQDWPYMDGSALNGALHLARLGYYVFPARIEVEPDGKVNKPPQRGVRWRDESTTDEAIIIGWWKRWNDAVVAIDCGKSGIVVLDVDPRHDGAWDEPGTYRTQGGGEHVLYREAKNSVIGCDNTGKVAPGVDIKGLGGYVVCWQPTEVQARPNALPGVPARVIEKMTLSKDTEAESVPVDHEAPRVRGLDPFGLPERTFTLEQATEYVRREAVDALKAARPGGRNDQLNRSAMVFGHFVPAFWTVDEVTAGLTTVARDIGLQPGEITATIRSGLSAGQRDPYTLVHSQSVDSPVDEASKVDLLLAEMLDTDGLDDIPEPEPLIHDFLVLDSLASIVGKSGKGKSFVTIDMACHVGTGQRWHGHDVVKGEVVYIVAEGARGIKKRVRSWERHHGMKATGVRFLPRPIQARDPEWLVLIEACKRIEPVMIVIDTQARVTVGIEENSAKEMGEFIDRAETLRMGTGACVVLVHHTGHQGDEGRGSTAVKGALQTQLSVSKQDLIVQVSTLKQKDDVEAEPLILALFEVGESAVLVAKDEPVRDDGGVERFVPVPDPEEVFTGHVKALIGVFLNVFSEGTGGTRPELRAHFCDLPEIRQLAVTSKRKAFDRSWARLEQMGRLARTEGTQRYKFITIDNLTGGDV